MVQWPLIRATVAKYRSDVGRLGDRLRSSLFDSMTWLSTVSDPRADGVVPRLHTSAADVRRSLPNRPVCSESQQVPVGSKTSLGRCMVAATRSNSLKLKFVLISTRQAFISAVRSMLSLGLQGPIPTNHTRARSHNMGSCQHNPSMNIALPTPTSKNKLGIVKPCRSSQAPSSAAPTMNIAFQILTALIMRAIRSRGARCCTSA